MQAFRDRGINYLFPKPPSRQQLEHTVGLVSSRKVQIAPLVTHRLDGLEKLLEAFEITAHKATHHALGPAQITVCKTI